MDADAIKRETELVRADWAGRGRHWDRRSDEIAEQAARMNAPLIEAADIAPGQQVCDIATGRRRARAQRRSRWWARRAASLPPTSAPR